MSSPVAERWIGFQARLEDAALIENGRLAVAEEQKTLESPEKVFPWLAQAVETTVPETVDGPVIVGALPELDWLPIATPSEMPESAAASRGILSRLVLMGRHDEPELPYHVPLYM